MVALKNEITVKVNGVAQRVPAGCSVSELVSIMKIQGAAIAVEINARICSKTDFDSVTLQDADVIEIVSLVGGG